jgi:hypothetical protein
MNEAGFQEVKDGNETISCELGSTARTVQEWKNQGHSFLILVASRGFWHGVANPRLRCFQLSLLSLNRESRVEDEMKQFRNHSKSRGNA